MMRTTSYSVTLFLFQLFLHFCLNNGRFQFGYASGCKTVEREALLKFKYSLHDPSNRLSSWLGEDCCDWAGVECDHITGHVRHLDLENPNPEDNSTELKSHNLDPSLGNLTNLRYLNLAWNDFQKSTLSDFIGSMKHLRFLDLAGASFGGVLPPQLGNLTSLRYLDLSFNSFYGSVPLWLRNMRALEDLSLGYNFFNHVEGGSVMGIMRNLCKLTYIRLQDNYIQGQIGEVYTNCTGNLRKLTSLDLSFNRFDGQIPSSIGDLSLLEGLFLSNNRFDGQIPSSIGNLSLLVMLYLNNNTFDGQIPMSIGRLSSLVILTMSSNFLEGTLSESHFANFTNLKMLLLGLNSLSLNFTSTWIPPFQLYVFYMNNNKIQGPFPRWIQTQQSLTDLDLSHNRIVGPITIFPSRLQMVQLSNNLLSQDNLFTNNNINTTNATSLCQLQYLEYIFLENNTLTGKIPNDCWENSTTLSYIYLSNNGLEGQIPSTLSHRFRSLEILDLGENQFTGQVPNVTMTQLSILRLRDNHLSGVIPFQMCSLHRLQILDLANNNLTGSIPNCLGKLHGMTSKPKVIDLSISFSLSENIIEVLKGEILSYTKNMYLVDIDLSCNGLVGSIPEELSNLSTLVGLNLSYNHLTGRIPEKIGEMRSLESLDFSNNNIYGIIPASMSGLYSLSHLNLSHNKLHGEIPTGHQLQTLIDPSIYAGNLGLCGDPLPNKCIRDHDKQEQVKQGEREQEDEAEDDYEKMVFCGVIILSFVAGFWGVIGSLLLKKQWRNALFQFVENFMNYLYVQLLVKINRFKG